jgi:hypothetical protein
MGFKSTTTTTTTTAAAALDYHDGLAAAEFL